jgi:hypothetical protein
MRSRPRGEPEEAEVLHLVDLGAERVRGRPRLAVHQRGGDEQVDRLVGRAPQTVALGTHPGEGVDQFGQEELVPAMTPTRAVLPVMSSSAA